MSGPTGAQLPSGAEPGGSVPGTSVPTSSVPGSSMPSGSVPGTSASTGSVSTGSVSTNAVSPNSVSTNAVSTDSVSAGPMRADPASDRPSARWTLLAAGDLRRALAARALLAVLGAIVLVFAAILLIRYGVRGDVFPPFITGGPDVVITRYSGPWIAGGSGLLLLGGLLMVSAATDLWRRRRLHRAGRAGHGGWTRRADPTPAARNGRL